ncbi:hypothetical protein [Oceanicoccus sp. KOV_DT_Chl]|uniref:hypothetical protein n=1 Tax=Oceanicoccus sp. KOV_DT_Chl TaxID=1904639 RepID=UPI000C7D7C96|nr:hypothetical protein [Oceanicoccus sp. KOV_DT_Chl]
MNRIKIVSVCLVVLLISACGTNAPIYEGSVENVKQLKKIDSSGVAVGKFSAATAGVKRISIRTNPLKSPHGKNVIDYLRYALEFELEKAGLLRADANKVIDAVVFRNEINAEGFVTGNGLISIEFSVIEDGADIYKKTFTVTRQWNSSFVGAIAIPAASSNYPMMVEELLGKLYGDADFIKVLAD